MNSEFVFSELINSQTTGAAITKAQKIRTPYTRDLPNPAWNL
jgi:hypothetical protein